jgi:hypothetical protein
MGYMCLTCLNEYYKEGLNLSKSIDGYNYRCPSVNCGDINVVEIDDMLMPIIKILNYKGYITRYCCSGHYYEKDTNTYISFDIETVPSIIPKGFVLEDEEYYKQNNWKLENLENHICIRKWYKSCRNKNYVAKEILKTMQDLMEWAEDLPYYTY